MERTNDYCVGIDLGTTNTVCAVWERGHQAPEIIGITQPDDFTSGMCSRSDLLPSALSVQTEGVFVGKAARQARCLGRGKTFTSTKRHMGKPWIAPTEFDWTPERVAGAVLSTVRQELDRRYSREPIRTVITVPASFGTEARRATLHAARLAGFDTNSIRLFDEPTAALLAELRREPQRMITAAPRRVMVIDIGGGTLDVSLVALHREAEQTIFDIQGQSRLNTLAGDDFDLNIAGLLLERFLDERGIQFQTLSHIARIRLCADLLLRAEEVKTRLSINLQGERRNTWEKIRGPVEITETPDGHRWRTEFNGEHLAAALLEYFPFDENPLRQREELTFFRPIQECLDSASAITGEAVEPHEVWLAGGSAYLPFIPLAVRRRLNLQPQMVKEPMYAVAKGAALFAGLPHFGPGEIIILERLFEGIYLQTADLTFIEMVGAHEVVPMAHIERSNLFTMPMADSRVEVDLFLGYGDSQREALRESPKLLPLARRRIAFPQLLPKGQSISVGVEVTANREVVFDFSTVISGERLTGQVATSLAFGGGLAGAEKPLPPINQPSIRMENGR